MDTNIAYVLISIVVSLVFVVFTKITETVCAEKNRLMFNISISALFSIVGTILSATSRNQTSAASFLYIGPGMLFGLAVMQSLTREPLALRVLFAVLCVPLYYALAIMAHKGFRIEETFTTVYLIIATAGGAVITTLLFCRFFHCFNFMKFSDILIIAFSVFIATIFLVLTIGIGIWQLGMGYAWSMIYYRKILYLDKQFDKTVI